MNKSLLKVALFRLVMAGGVITFAAQYPFAAQAHHRDGHNGGPPNRATETQNAPDSVAALTAEQRDYLTGILRDDNHPDADLIDAATRSAIQAQVTDLPPGIQRQLARGRGLPPGIAKKVLPTSLNDRLGLGDGVQIIVVGSDVATVDPVTGLIVDILRDVLL